ncbi:MAG: hypothetical protein OXO48_01795 [Caldilineaceae bacterium]|nr:hypothetical protein [Caldilineaceae bacterium]
MSYNRKALVLAAAVVLLLALGVSQLQAQSPLTHKGDGRAAAGGPTRV